MQGAGLIVSLAQVGYARGLFFLAPIADLLENRRLLIITALAATVGLVGLVGLVGAGIASHPAMFLLMSLLVGLSSVTVQILIPLAAHLAPGPSRGAWSAPSWAGCCWGSCWRGHCRVRYRRTSDGARFSSLRRS